jgi:hypothetical protein
MKALSIVLPVLIVATVAASTPLAMRVDIGVKSVGRSTTTLRVTAQLAPEDRSRLGRQARMRVKLSDGDRTVAHVLKDVDIDQDGSAGAVFDWPPGRYELEVSLEALRGDAKGLWAGAVEVPANNVDDADAALAEVHRDAAPTVAATPAPVAAPPKDGTSAAAPATKVSEPAVEPEPALAATATAAAVDSDGLEPESKLVGEPAAPEPAPLPAPKATPVPRPTESPTAPAPNPQSTLPVHMVVALDVTADESARATAIARELEHKALAAGGRSAAFSSADAATENAPGILRAALHSSVTSHFGAPIVLLTDGRRPASKAAWKEAETAARRGEIPVLAVGLWTPDFPAAVQKRLRKIADVSGGRVFFLQGSDATSTVVALFEEVLKANEE